MKRVYIIGTQHPYQMGIKAPRPPVPRFQEVLRQNIEKHGIAGIAEEMNDEWLKSCGVDASVGEGVSKELGLPHKYCEASAATRTALGIKSVLNPRREEFWMEVLMASFSVFPVLFICGSAHTRGFRALLTASGFDADILYRNWPNSPDCLPGRSASNPTAAACTVRSSVPPQPRKTLNAGCPLQDPGR